MCSVTHITINVTAAQFIHVTRVRRVIKSIFRNQGATVLTSTVFLVSLKQARSTVSGYRVVLYTSMRITENLWNDLNFVMLLMSTWIQLLNDFFYFSIYLLSLVRYIYIFYKNFSRRITVTEFDYAAKCRQIAEATEGLSGREISKIAVAWQTSAFASSDGVLTEEMIDEKVMLAVEDHKKKEDWNRYRLPGDVVEVYRSEKDAAAATLKSSVWRWRQFSSGSRINRTARWRPHYYSICRFRNIQSLLEFDFQLKKTEKNSVIGYSNISLFQILVCDCMSTAQDLNVLELNSALFRKQSVYPENTESCYNRACDGAPLFLSRKQSWTV